MGMVCILYLLMKSTVILVVINEKVKFIYILLERADIHDKINYKVEIINIIIQFQKTW